MPLSTLLSLVRVSSGAQMGDAPLSTAGHHLGLLISELHITQPGLLLPYMPSAGRATPFHH